MACMEELIAIHGLYGNQAVPFIFVFTTRVI